MNNNIELVMEGLHCAGCSQKIEDEVRKIKGVKVSTINFMSKLFTVELEEGADLKTTLEKITETIKRIEPDVIVREKEIETLYDRNFMLLGLCCADCASKIERKVCNISGVEEANIDFVNQKLKVRTSGGMIESIRREIIGIIKEIEPEVKVIEEAVEEKAVEYEKHVFDKKELIRFAAGTTLFVGGFFTGEGIVTILIYLTAYFLIGTDVVLKAVRNIARGDLFDENFLMSIATIGAFAIGEYHEAVGVMLFYMIGEALQEMAIDKSRKNIKKLLSINPDFANILEGGEEIKKRPETIKAGDLVIVKPGEKVPIDGIIIEGEGYFDTKAITGESMPKYLKTGDEITGGYIAANGFTKIRAEKEYKDSTISKIMHLVENAAMRKAKMERFITRFARVYTPIVVGIAALIAVVPTFIYGLDSFSTWLYRALIFLVVSCPCALVISIPLGFMGGIGAASKKGILIKGGNYLEAMAKIDKVVFDKTGTITKGILTVKKIIPAGEFTEAEILAAAAYAEIYSNHPVGEAIVKYYGTDINREKIIKFDEKAGYGIEAVIEGKKVILGNSKLLGKNKINVPIVENEEGIAIFAAIEGKYAGCIIIHDELKAEAHEAIQLIKNSGIKKVFMFTGDNKETAKKISTQIGIDEYYAELLPTDKVEKLEELEKFNGKNKIAFVGEGINDAPVITRADVGIAMGMAGSDAAIEAADIIIMNDNLLSIAEAVKISKKTNAIIIQNIVIALGIKIIVLILGTFGLATMWEAVFADVGVALLAVLNASRMLRIK